MKISSPSVENLKKDSSREAATNDKEMEVESRVTIDIGEAKSLPMNMQNLKLIMERAHKSIKVAEG